ncbi:alpha/beta fold hydrolase [Cupriavidus sp. 2TAF22]|uniref:alpha/beta fold hydrolase n=1 Tax=unclassified Cupriavidus TaxID=2640874 RepID=UPI003F8E24D6
MPDFTPRITTVALSGRGRLHVVRAGDPRAPAVFLSHSILSSHAMWDAQAALLASRGWQVVRADIRGHGDSTVDTAPASMDDLVADTVAVLDTLDLEQVHYVGLSLGGMIGFGLGLHHAERLLSLCLCDARADAPPEVAAPWDARIEQARAGGCAALADGTLERWFGLPFLTREPETAARLRAIAASTSVTGFAGCARAIQQLNYLPALAGIRTCTTLLVGANDGVLPEANKAIQTMIQGSRLDLIEGAGHLPNIDQPERFNAALLRHLARKD